MLRFVILAAVVAEVDLERTQCSGAHWNEECKAPPSKGANSMLATRRHAWKSAEAQAEEKEVVAEKRSPDLFPFVQKLHSDGACCAHLSPNVQVVPQTKGSMLNRAALRATRTLQRLAALPKTDETSAAGNQPWNVLKILVSVDRNETDEVLNEHSDYSYTISCTASAGTCSIRAPSVYGASAALDSTLVQLFAEGKAAFQSLELSDWPQYSVRGMMVDVGRRFVPKDVLLHQVIDGMAMVRMNVLQLHLNDFCRFALKLPGFPELDLEGYMEGQYTIDDVKDIVSYANDRGIRVVPEVDLPGHASGLLQLKSRGLQFCEPRDFSHALPEDAAKIYDDPQGRSRAVLDELLAATAEAFGADETWFHIGGDEVKPTGLCTQENFVGLEQFLTADLVAHHLKHTPVGWGDVLLKVPKADGERAAGDETVMMTWQEGNQVRDVLDRGHKVIAATMSHHYLDQTAKERPASNFWYDLAEAYKVTEADRHRLLGGMSVMWTDRYCYTYQCGAANEEAARRVGSVTLPTVPAMFHREFDNSFGRSMASMIWPRAGVTAAALWKFSADVTSHQIQEKADWLSNLLQKVSSIASCPVNCHCDEVSACGKPHSISKTAATSLIDAASGSQSEDVFKEEINLLSRCFSARSFHAVDQSKEILKVKDELLQCFWQGRKCHSVGSWRKQMNDDICWPPKEAAKKLKPA